MTLTDKVAIISGAAQGIGFAVAKEMIAQGASVVIGDINPTTGEKAADALGKRARFVTLNVASQEDWQAAFKFTLDTFDKVDILVNCAGITGEALDVEHESLTDWDKVFAVNAQGPFLGIQQAMVAMINGGSIINVVSMAGMYAEPVAVAYSSSKGAARMLTKHAALYGVTKEHKIRVNAVFPGSTNTPMVKQISELQPEVMKAQLEKIPMKRFAEPEDMANMIAYLASDKADYITGAEFTLDGGISAGF